MTYFFNLKNITRLNNCGLPAVYLLATSIFIHPHSVLAQTLIKQEFVIDVGSLQNNIALLAKQSKQKIHLSQDVNPLLITRAFHGSFDIEQALHLLIKDTDLWVSGNAIDGYIIHNSTLPDIQVIANKDSRTINLNGNTEKSKLISLVRHQVLVSVPITASGSGNIWDSNGNAGFNIRGIEGNRIGLEIDDIPLPEAAPKPDSTSMHSFATGREYFDIEMMQEMRILNGAQEINNNNTGLGGKIQFRSKAPNDFLSQKKSSYLAYKITHDSVNSSKLHSLTGAWGNDQIKSMLIYAHRDGQENKTLSKIAPNPDNWDSQAILAKLDWHISDLQKLNIAIDLFKRNSQQIFNNRTSSLYPQGVKQFALTEKNRFSINHEYALGLSLLDHLSTKVYYQDAQQKDISLANYVLRNKPYFRTINTSFNNTYEGLSFNAAKNLQQHDINYGLKLESTDSSRPWYEDRLVLDSGAHQVSNKNRMADMNGRNLSLYISDKIKFKIDERYATLTPAIRYETRKLTPKNLNTYIVGVPSAALEIKEKTDSFAVPSLRFEFHHNTSLSSFAAYSRNTRPVSAAEKTGTYDSFSYTGTGQGYAILGNPKLKNESNHAFEIGFNATPNRAINLQVSSFYNNYSNFIEYAIQAPDPINYPTITYGLFRPENIGKARTWGAEIATQINLEKLIPSWKGMHVDFAFGAANGTAKNTKTGARNFLPSIAPMKASFKLAYEHPLKLYGIALSGVLVDEKQAPTDVVMSGAEIPNYRIPKYNLFDVDTFWNVNSNIKVNISILNLMNRRYWDYANSRKLPAIKNDTDLTAKNDIERQVMPGRSINLSMQLKY